MPCLPNVAVRCLPLVTGITLATGVAASGQRPLADANASRRAAALLRQMTLEEKIGQLNLAAGVALGGTMPAASDRDIVHGRVGAILWLADPKTIDRMQHLEVEKSRLHIPLLFGLDVIHGYRTLCPIPLGMASSWDPAVEEAAQAFAAKEAAASGIRWTFTPMVDIARDARWGRIQEGAGEDPYLGSAMARALRGGRSSWCSRMAGRSRSTGWQSMRRRFSRHGCPAWKAGTRLPTSSSATSTRVESFP